jgi:hypothetical protein
LPFKCNLQRYIVGGGNKRPKKGAGAAEVAGAGMVSTVGGDEGDGRVAAAEDATHPPATAAATATAAAIATAAAAAAATATAAAAEAAAAADTPGGEVAPAPAKKKTSSFFMKPEERKRVAAEEAADAAREALRASLDEVKAADAALSAVGLCTLNQVDP